MENYEKLYKEALERAKHYTWYSTNRSDTAEPIKNAVEAIFPELRESEDERIRKELLEHCINRRDGKQICVDASDYRRWAAWLEKQGEQKHKIVPKFRVGDTIRFKGNETLKGEDKTHRIIDYDNELYVFDDGTTDLFSEQNLYELVEQKPSWSEEDEKMINLLIKILEVNHPNEHFKVNPIGTTNMEAVSTKEIVDWLKSIKPNHWKPSEEQMEALNAINNIGELSYAGQADLLIKLYNDLEKL